ncbi:MAG TPA: DUF456 domain-containing protein [Usitatibacter sp.]|nr:DUF456 domain-containing protein [Usitatibacter sp.]
MTLRLLLDALAILLVIAGLAGTVLPVLPGALLVFAGLVVAAWADDFARVGFGGLAIIAALGLISMGVDFLGSILGAKRVGASPQALAGAAIGALAGLFFGVPGLVLGPFVGAVLGELLARGGLIRAGKVGLGTSLGLLLAAVAKLVLAFAMIAVFVAFYLFNS